MNVGQEKIIRLLDGLCVLLALVFIASFLMVAMGSFNYPFGLEWMEGHSIDIIQRIRNGLPIYTPPSLEYVPFIYTPYYFYLSALVSFATGVDFIAGRLVSIISTLGTALILYQWIKREGGSWKIGVITAGLYFATYKLSGRWFDVARIDSLYNLLLLGGLYVFYFYRGFNNALIAAAILSVAFFTKQLTLITVMLPLIGGIMLDKKHALQTLGLFLSIVFLGTAIANVITDGWFVFYVFEVPAGHGLEERIIIDFWQKDIARSFACQLAVMTMAILYCRTAEQKKMLWYCALAIGVVGAVYASRLHWGGWLNVLMPMHMIFALLAGRALVSLKNYADKALMPVAVLLLCFQFFTQLYLPGPLIPSEESVRQGKLFLEEIANIPGDIFTSEIQFVQTRVGKKSYTYGMAAFDVLRSDLGSKNYIKQQLRKELRTALAEHRFSAVIAGRLLRLPEKNAYYRFAREVDYPREYVTGAIPGASTSIFVPRDKNSPPDRTQPLGSDIGLDLEDDNDK